METDNKTYIKPIDGRVALYRIVGVFLVIGAIGFIVKFLLFDTVLIQTDQMSPTLLSGDRALMFRGSPGLILQHLFTPSYNDIVLVNSPFRLGAKACLRIAGLGGDSVSIAGGKFFNVNQPPLKNLTPPSPDLVLPPEYSPRDCMAMFRVPQVGETYTFDSLSLRDFFFCASMMAQENRKTTYTVKADLSIDDSITNDYFITTFPLYKGRFDAIPDTLRFNWFFWDRLREYLHYTIENRTVLLTFALFDKEMPITEYTVRKPFAFLLADNWIYGYDSRYFGPVSLSLANGTIVAVLWSMGKKENGKSFLRVNRLIRILF